MAILALGWNGRSSENQLVYDIADAFDGAGDITNIDAVGIRFDDTFQADTIVHSSNDQSSEIEGRFRHQSAAHFQFDRMRIHQDRLRIHQNRLAVDRIPQQHVLPSRF